MLFQKLISNIIWFLKPSGNIVLQSLIIFANCIYYQAFKEKRKNNVKLWLLIRK